MALIFPKSTDKYVKIGAALVAFLAVGGVALALYIGHPENIMTGYAPTQPVPYSHKLHVGDLGMDCYYCHYTTDRSAHAAIPQTEICMNCHVRVKPDSPRLAKVRQSYQTGAPIDWVRVHRLPDFVFFNHQAHVTAGVSCVTCHGRVDQMVEVKQVEPMNMAWCLDCHRHPEPHIRPIEEVTNLGWKPEGDPVSLGQAITQARRIDPPEHCSGCHR